ncbi:MAG: cation-translocating P-type ATPase [Flexilinea sp.]
MSFLPLQSLRKQEVFDFLATSPDGLSADEIQARLNLYGKNCLNETPSSSPVKKWIQYAVHPMALLLLAAGLGAIRIGHVELGVVVWMIVFINATSSFWREFRAGQAVAALKKMLPAGARVVRSGQEKIISSIEVVPGDILVLAEGDNIPADARLVESYGLRTNNSTLTGDAMPVIKSPEPIMLTELSEIECANLVFSGTSIVSGTGKAVVYATGMCTQIGRIANLTQNQKEEPSPLQKQMNKTTRLLSLVALGIGAIVFFVGITDVGIIKSEALILSIGILVATLPEGLAPTVTLTLAMAVQRLAHKGVLVKKLAVLETLGSVSVLCTDKSGTLTQNQMTVREIWTIRGRYKVSGVGYDPGGEIFPGKINANGKNNSPDLDIINRTAVLCNNSRLIPPDAGYSNWSSLGDQTEAALRVMAIKNKTNQDIVEKKYPRIHEIPFDARRKRMTTIHPIEDQLLICTKGAPKEVLQLCTHILQDGNPVELDEETRYEILRVNDEYSSSALRVLALAQRVCPLQIGSYSAQNIEQNLTFLGLVGMMDPPRLEVAQAIEALHHAGIRMVMITGDYGLTAESIARRVGMITARSPRILTGAEMDLMDDDTLTDLLDQDVIYSRMAPEHKLRIVNTLKAHGEVVAVVGDGVNDTPAIRAADVGIAMGITGTDVAKEAADIIIMKDNFSAIISAIEEGRAIFDNLRKFITYIFASNVPEVLPFLLTAIFNIPLALTVTQIIAIDFGTDLLPALALGGERPEPDVMMRSPRKRDQPLVDRSLLLRSFLWLGGIESILCFAAFFFVYSSAGYTLLNFSNSDISFNNPGGALYLFATTVYYAGVVISQIGVAYGCRTEKSDVHQMGWFSNRNLLVATLFSLASLILTIYYSPLEHLFHHTALPLITWFSLGLFIPILYCLGKMRIFTRK